MAAQFAMESVPDFEVEDGKTYAEVSERKLWVGVGLEEGV